MLWSIKINSELHYCCLLCYLLVCTLLATVDDTGRCFGHHCPWRASNYIKIWEVERNILISMLILRIYWNPLVAALQQTCARLPAPQAAWIYQIHTTGWPGGSTTMVAVVVTCLCCCGWTRDVTRPSYVKRYKRITLKVGLWVLQREPPRLAPYHIALVWLLCPSTEKKDKTLSA